MKAKWDVSDLTTVEEFYLKHKVKGLIPKFEEERKLVKRRKMNPNQLAQIERDAAGLWLLDLYDTRIDSIPMVYVLRDVVDGETYEISANRKDLLTEKKKELKAQGHMAYKTLEVSPQWKRDLQIIRDKANHEQY